MLYRRCNRLVLDGDDFAKIMSALLNVEWNLIAGTSPSSTEEIPAIVQQTLACDFEAVFRSDAAKNLLSASNSISTTNGTTDATGFEVVDCLKILQTPLEGAEDELSRLSIGISALHAFAQVNWTGPNLTFTPSEVIHNSNGEPLSTSDGDAERKINSQAISSLSSNGEPAYHLSRCATFLYLALQIFRLPFQHIKTAPWWSLRADRIHKDILDEPTSIPSDYFERLDALESQIPTDGDNVDLTGRLRTEKALMYHLLKQDKLAAQEFVQSAKAMGLHYELTGVKGRRTKFQVDEVTQLVLLAKSRERENAVVTSHGSGEAQNTTNGTAPETLPLNDDTLLEKTEYTSTSASAHTTSSALTGLDPNDQPALHPLDQCVLLGLCLNVRNTSPQHGLTSEQMSPYISRVISHPQNWSVHTMSLLLRSRLEANRTRTVERSTLQLQALIDQMPTSDSSVSERLRYFHQIALPSKWDMERELAMRLVGLGVLKSALEILERLEMWEECVQCWQAMEQPKRGLEIVRDLLEGTKEEADQVLRRGKEGAGRERVRREMDRAREAKLWCLLGELESEHAEEHFKKAWEVSEHKSGRAARSLGGYYFARGHYPEASRFLKEAVTIQPLLAKSWFILGCALVREEKWKDARDAFGRCVALDEEDGESWNNLASVYLRLGSEATDEKVEDRDDAELTEDGPSDSKSRAQKKLENKVMAFRALQQGLKNNYSNWRMWSNYTAVAVDVGELSEACHAIGRVVEERSEKDGEGSVDVEILERLVSVVTRATDPEPNEQESRPTNPNEGLGLYVQLDNLFTQIILPRISGSSRIWKARAQLLTWRNRWTDALEAYSAAYRCGVATDTKLEVEVERWREAIGELEEYVDVLRNFGPKALEEREKQGDSGTRKKREGSWGFQARGVVRTFMGRTRAAFEDEPEWERLKELADVLKQTA
ncbi:hypothetical protein M408DRAFT_25041 [Serendipita vermifera MAFF 305830]|uniref:Uncharacterized protein n=1 Tax=Serendipita vermifera MAFF 305830 TaxID=933852 RepID=A0A0C3B5K8_SERVB|nr:hypothetical protein M408DRAFT_25041 [Serendipita vermifera MAFF 305830]